MRKIPRKKKTTKEKTPKKKKSKRKKLRKISTESAKRINRKRTTAARALDAVRKNKKSSKRPNTRWSKNPAKSDVRGIDDGSKLAKKRNEKQIKQHFGKIGKRGANKTNAKRANKALLKQTQDMKKLLQAKRNATTPEKREKMAGKIKVLKKNMTKNQKLVARWQGNLN